ncbi:MAG: acetoin utilization protein AcuC [Thermoplasmata archaeon]
MTHVSTPSLSVVWDERFESYDFGVGHPFSERSRGLAVDLLASVGDARRSGPLEWIRRVGPASPEVLESFHRPKYVEFVRQVSGTKTPTPLDAGDTPSFPGCFEEAARIVEGAQLAIGRTMETSCPAFHPAGGLHHAHPERASGFCIFNDVAIAVARLANRGRRVAYVDIDAHHGDGVMYGFYDSGRVLDIDFHQDGRTLFPGTGALSETGRGDGAGLKVNVPLPPLCGDEALLPLFRRLVPTLLRSFRPEVIVLQHGVDGHAGDALTQLQYTPAAYAEVDSTILGLAKELSGGRLMVTGGGGYRAATVSRVLARTGLLLARLPSPPAGQALPETWRARYHGSMGEGAPSTWEDPGRPTGSPWQVEHATKLIGALETALGRGFPPVAPP